MIPLSNLNRTYEVEGAVQAILRFAPGSLLGLKLLSSIDHKRVPIPQIALFPTAIPLLKLTHI